MYWVRALGGSLYVSGVVMCLINMVMTWRNRPVIYEEPVHEAPALEKDWIGEEPQIVIPAHRTMLDLGYQIQFFTQAAWHRVWERKPLKFTLWVVVAVATASLFEIIPTFLIRSNVPSIASVKPYTPLELAGRDIYVSEGCYNCHSQMIRPIRAETERYGEYSKPGEFIYDRPFQWGSIMPKYSWLLTDTLDFAGIQRKVDVMAMLGVPYGKAVNSAEAMARAQAAVVSASIQKQGGPADLADKKIIALVAYLQRLGTDINAPSAPAEGGPPVAGATGDQHKVLARTEGR
jgi:cytochrome c oxidase cbb3-type subunit I/II